MGKIFGSVDEGDQAKSNFFFMRHPYISGALGIFVLAGAITLMAGSPDALSAGGRLFGAFTPDLPSIYGLTASSIMSTVFEFRTLIVGGAIVLALVGVAINLNRANSIRENSDVSIELNGDGNRVIGNDHNGCPDGPVEDAAVNRGRRTTIIPKLSFI